MSLPVKLSSPATREFWEIPVLFEDAHLLVLEKPSGLHLMPDADQPQRPSLMKLMHEGIAAGKPWARERQLDYLSHVHRLDAEVSGVLILAKTKAAQAGLADLFGTERPVRHYVALAWGQPPEARFEVEAKLSPHPVKAGQMYVDPLAGKKSQTQFERLEQFSDWVLLRCSPLTERPHQVRVHLKHAGFTAVGDDLYGGKKLWLSRMKRDFRLKPNREERPLMARPAVHLEELTLPHPVTGESLTFKSEWPKDLRVAVKFLRQYAVAV